MSIYVDNMSAPFGRMLMSHMFADSSTELIAMADRIGVARKWIQKAGTIYEHFDVCQAMRKKAVKAGAIEVTMKEYGIWLRGKRARVSANASVNANANSNANATSG